MMLLLTSLMSFHCFSQGKIFLPLELNTLRGSAFINDSTVLVASSTYRFTSGLGYQYGFEINDNLSLEVGIIFTYFGEEFALKDVDVSFTDADIKEFFRFKFPIKVGYSFDWVKPGIALLPTLNLDMIDDISRPNFDILNQSFNNFNFGLLFDLEFQLSRSFRWSLYYNTYLTPQYSINGSNFMEDGFGLGISYLPGGKKVSIE